MSIIIFIYLKDENGEVVLADELIHKLRSKHDLNKLMIENCNFMINNHLYLGQYHLTKYDVCPVMFGTELLNEK